MEKEYRKLSSLYYQYSKPIGFSFDGDIEYYTKELMNVEGSILEAGVGTGRLLIPLLEAGLSVDGVDNSLDMLELCKLNLHKWGLSSNLTNQDLVELNLDKKYDAIIMPTGSFCLIEKTKALHVLQLFYDHLSDKGRIIVDIEMPSYFKPYTTSSSHVKISDTKWIHLNTENKDMDWLNQKTTSKNTYQLIEKGVVISDEQAKFVLYWYGMIEFEMFLKEANFKDISYELGYGTNKGDLVTFIAYKTGR